MGGRGFLLALAAAVLFTGTATAADPQAAATTPHAYGWLSLLPPVVAIGLAIATRRVVLSLLAGVAAGALILSGGHPGQAAQEMAETHLWPSLTDPDHLRVFVFTALMGAMVGVMHRSGGMHGLVAVLSRWAHNRRRGQATTWILGLAIFFDDYANSLLLGTTLRPLADRLRISREKLAYLVDSTSAPVAGLALVSTWVATEISYIGTGYEQLGLETGVNSFAIFVETIPYRFYPLWALVLVIMVSLTNRDFGPMLRAERQAVRLGSADRDEELAAEFAEIEPAAGIPLRWYNAIIPISVVVAVVLWLLYATGRAALAEEGIFGAGVMSTFGQGDSYLALLYASLAGLITAIVLASSQRLLDRTAIARSARSGAIQMTPALVILWLAWALSNQTNEEHLGTAVYLSDLLRQAVSPAWMPTLAFLLAGGVAFSTGTSWGTMSMLMPLTIAVTYSALSGDAGPPAANHPILLGAIGSVLAGAIWGDHCSPISDTTVLSARASGCDHIAHVRTQLPYAMLVGTLAMLLGTIPIGWGISVWWLVGLGPVALAVWMWLIAHPVEAAATNL